MSVLTIKEKFQNLLNEFNKEKNAYQKDLDEILISKDNPYGSYLVNELERVRLISNKYLRDRVAVRYNILKNISDNVRSELDGIGNEYGITGAEIAEAIKYDLGHLTKEQKNKIVDQLLEVVYETVRKEAIHSETYIADVTNDIFTVIRDVSGEYLNQKVEFINKLHPVLVNNEQGMEWEEVLDEILQFLYNGVSTLAVGSKLKFKHTIDMSPLGYPRAHMFQSNKRNVGRFSFKVRDHETDYLYMNTGNLMVYLRDKNREKFIDMINFYYYFDSDYDSFEIHETNNFEACSYMNSDFFLIADMIMYLGFRDSLFSNDLNTTSLNTSIFNNDFLNQYLDFDSKKLAGLYNRERLDGLISMVSVNLDNKKKSPYFMHINIIRVAIIKAIEWCRTNVQYMDMDPSIISRIETISDKIGNIFGLLETIKLYGTPLSDSLEDARRKIGYIYNLDDNNAFTDIHALAVGVTKNTSFIGGQYFVEKDFIGLVMGTDNELFTEYCKEFDTDWVFQRLADLAVSLKGNLKVINGALNIAKTTVHTTKASLAVLAEGNYANGGFYSSSVPLTFNFIYNKLYMADLISFDGCENNQYKNKTSFAGFVTNYVEELLRANLENPSIPNNRLNYDELPATYKVLRIYAYYMLFSQTNTSRWIFANAVEEDSNSYPFQLPVPKDNFESIEDYIDRFHPLFTRDVPSYKEFAFVKCDVFSEFENVSNVYTSLISLMTIAYLRNYRHAPKFLQINDNQPDSIVKLKFRAAIDYMYNLFDDHQYFKVLEEYNVTGGELLEQDHLYHFYKNETVYPWYLVTSSLSLTNVHYFNVEHLEKQPYTFHLANILKVNNDLFNKQIKRPEEAELGLIKCLEMLV